MRRRPRESHGWRGLLRSGRVTGSREAGVYPIPVRRLRLRPRNWVAVATANGQACAEWATRGDERRNTAAHGHGISLGAGRTALVLGVDEAGSVSWRSRARRLVGSAARRLDGPSAHQPSGRGNSLLLPANMGPAITSSLPRFVLYVCIKMLSYKLVLLLLDFHQCLRSYYAIQC